MSAFFSYTARSNIINDLLLIFRDGTKFMRMESEDIGHFRCFTIRVEGWFRFSRCTHRLVLLSGFFRIGQSIQRAWRGVNIILCYMGIDSSST